MECIINRRLIQKSEALLRDQTRLHSNGDHTVPEVFLTPCRDKWIEHSHRQTPLSGLSDDGTGRPS